MTNNTGHGDVGLKDFAEARRKPTRCLVCNLPDPLRAEVEAAKGVVSYRLMVEWLQQVHGYEAATRHKLEVHWQDKHPQIGDN